MDEKTLNEILPTPSRDEMEESIIDDLKVKKFTITNFRNGVFRTLLSIFLQACSEFYTLLKSVLLQIYLKNATGQWLDAKAAEYGKARKSAIKTEGIITCSRDQAGNEIIIAKGTQFRDTTKKYIFIAKDDVTMAADQTTVSVSVLAEASGQIYNLAPNTIIESIQYISGIDSITNESDWITTEGADQEDDESLRQRCFNVWEELAVHPTGGKYAAVTMNVEGVESVYVDDLHPRGQGTVDIIITGANGDPTQTLIDKVTEAVNEVKGSYDNILVKGATIVNKDVSISIYVETLYSQESEIIQDAKDVITTLFNNNKVYLAEIVQSVMNMNSFIKNVTVSDPTTDISVNVGEHLKVGTITVNVTQI